MIDQIRTILGDRYGSPGFSDIKFYSSKKNAVASVDNEVIKFFVFGDIRKESEIYSRCLRGDIRVPDLIYQKENIMILRLIREQEVNQKEKIKHIFRWLRGFHEKTGMCKGDQRLHNYIWDGKDLFGIDFEESYHGNFQQDLAELCVTLLKEYRSDEIDIMLSEYSADLRVEHLKSLMLENIRLRRSWNEYITF